MCFILINNQITFNFIKPTKSSILFALFRKMLIKWLKFSLNNQCCFQRIEYSELLKQTQSKLKRLNEAIVFCLNCSNFFLSFFLLKKKGTTNNDSGSNKE